MIEHTVQQLLKELHKSYEQNGKTVEVSASLGIVTAPEHGTTFEELYQKSDQMLYEVKRSVKNGYRLYQEKESEHETDFNCRCQHRRYAGGDINKRGVWRKPCVFGDGSVFIHIIFEKEQLPAYE